VGIRFIKKLCYFK